MNYPISNIQLDPSIQARASVNTEAVQEYADSMTEGDTFPPIVLFGDAESAWIGDGWHRVLAAQSIGYKEIPADLRKGGRPQAIEYAVGANRDHGMRRTNADKRRAVEIALEAWPTLSSRNLAERCGVSDKTVEAVRETCGISARRTDSIGRSQPAKKQTAPAQEPASDPDDIPGYREGDGEPPAPTGPVLSSAMRFAARAIGELKNIEASDPKRYAALDMVARWIEDARRD